MNRKERRHKLKWLKEEQAKHRKKPDLSNKGWFVRDTILKRKIDELTGDSARDYKSSIEEGGSFERFTKEYRGEEDEDM